MNNRTATNFNVIVLDAGLADNMYPSFQSLAKKNSRPDFGTLLIMAKKQTSSPESSELAKQLVTGGTFHISTVLSGNNGALYGPEGTHSSFIRDLHLDEENANIYLLCPSKKMLNETSIIDYKDSKNAIGQVHKTLLRRPFLPQHLLRNLPSYFTACLSEDDFSYYSTLEGQADCKKVLDKMQRFFPVIAPSDAIAKHIDIIQEYLNDNALPPLTQLLYVKKHAQDILNLYQSEGHSKDNLYRFCSVIHQIFREGKDMDTFRSVLKKLVGVRVNPCYTQTALYDLRKSILAFDSCATILTNERANKAASLKKLSGELLEDFNQFSQMSEAEKREQFPAFKALIIGKLDSESKNMSGRRLNLKTLAKNIIADLLVVGLFLTGYQAYHHLRYKHAFRFPFSEKKTNTTKQADAIKLALNKALPHFKP